MCLTKRVYIEMLYRYKYVGLYDKYLNFVPFRGRKFTEGDAFIGYQKDTPAAVVFQATHQLEREGPVVSPQGRKTTEPVSVLGPRARRKEDVRSL